MRNARVTSGIEGSESAHWDNLSLASIRPTIISTRPKTWAKGQPCFARSLRVLLDQLQPNLRGMMLRKMHEEARRPNAQPARRAIQQLVRMLRHHPPHRLEHLFAIHRREVGLRQPIRPASVVAI